MKNNLPANSGGTDSDAARIAQAAAAWRARQDAGLTAAVVLGLWMLSSSRDPVTRFAESTPTEEGLLKRDNLPDGSVVRLRAATAIDVLYGPKARHVRLLRGEAHFSVVKDSARPFVVETNGVGVRAVGTAFTVASRSDTVEILVTEGRVRVESTRTEDPGATLLPPSTVAGTPLLEAGEKAVVSLGAAMAADARTAVERLPPAQLALAVAWQQRVLAFDAALGSRRFGGSFRADDPDGFVALLSASSEIAVEERERETVIRTR